MVEDCLFCKIIDGEIPSSKIYEDEFVFGFEDINPQARTHLLFIHKKHTTNLNQLFKEDPEQLAQLFSAITNYSEEKNLLEGYRIVSNIGRKAGQTVFHTHFHLLSGEQLGKFGR